MSNNKWGLVYGCFRPHLSIHLDFQGSLLRQTLRIFHNLRDVVNGGTMSHSSAFFKSSVRSRNGQQLYQIIKHQLTMFICFSLI